MFCTTVVHNDTHTHTQAVFTVDCWFRFTPCQRLRINSNNLLSNVHILEAWRWSSQTNKSTSFIALTLLVGRQEDNLACKNWVVRYWHDYLSEASCKWFAYGPDDASATPSSLASFMVALCNRADHYIFILFLLSSFFPRLISAVGDWMFTILWHMVWP